MSATTKRKFVAHEVMNEYVLPDESKEVVRVICGRGNNLHLVSNEAKEEFLVSMPNKFRKSVYIKRGDFVLVEKIPEGGKVKAEIVNIPLKSQIKYIKEKGLWPRAFLDEAVQPSEEEDLFVNTNRRVIEEYTSSSEEDDLE